MYVCMYVHGTKPVHLPALASEPTEVSNSRAASQQSRYVSKTRVCAREGTIHRTRVLSSYS